MKAETFRKVHPMHPDDYCGPGYGYFEVPTREFKRLDKLRIIFDDGRDTGWEHASVSLATRTPTWAEMCVVKDIFWREDEATVQFHPPKAEHVNFMPFCLHIWRPLAFDIVTPPSGLVGPKKLFD